MLRPERVSATYSSSLPGSEASAPVTWTPRTSTGSGRGRMATWSVDALAAEACSLAPPAAFSPLPASVIPAASASTARSSSPTTAARRRRLRRRTLSRRARKRSFGSSDGYNMDTGSESVGDAWPRCCQSRLSTIRVDGALRPRHPAADRGRPDRHRPLRPRAHAALEPRRPLRPPVSGVPELAVPVHRRQDGAGGADGARRSGGRGGVHPPPGRVRPRLDPRARDAARRSRGPARGEIVASAGSAC